MELVNDFVNNQLTLYIPVALVLVGAILVFAFGFKSAEQPPFDKLSSISSEERKTPGKKRKLKEKKPAVNGSVVNVNDNRGDKSPSKETKRKEQLENTKKADNVNKPVIDKKKTDSAKIKTTEDKNKKNLKAKVNEKPLDFDDGNWETVPSKGEKKKKQDSPVKKEKKNKKTDKALEIDKLVKDVVNKELQEKEKSKEIQDLIIKEEHPIEVEEVKVKIEPEEIKIEPVEIKIEPVEIKIEPVEIKIEPVVIKKEKKVEKKSKKPDVENIDNSQDEKVEVDAKPAPTPAATEPPETTAKAPSGTVAFDELGDVWTEAKQPKKSKKKSRRDN